MREIESDLTENKTTNDKQQYEVLYQKEKEIDEFTAKSTVHIRP